MVGSRAFRVALVTVLLLAASGLAASANAFLTSGPPVTAVRDGPPDPARVADSPEAPADLDALKVKVRTIAQTRLTAGMSVAVIEDGRVVWAEGFGLADVAAGRPATADTVYRVGSLSKSVLSLTLAALEADGEVDLDAPLREVVGDGLFENRWESTHPVRITDLLQHAAGFDEMRFNEMFAARDELDWSTDKVLGLNPRSRKTRWRPGTRHAYSHPSYTAAGHVVERITGRPFEAVVRDRLFAPLGLREASFVPTETTDARLAVPYKNRGLEPFEPLYLHHRPGSHLYASAAEFGRIVALLAGRGVVDGRRVLPASVIERIETGNALPYRDLVPEYGLGVYELERAGVISFAHGGWMPGYFSSFRYVPSTGAGFVLLTNEPCDWGAPFSDLDDLLLAYVERGAPAMTPAPPAEVSEAELSVLAGKYAPIHHEVEFARAFDLWAPVEIELAEGSLRMRQQTRHGQRVHELVPLGDGRFRRSGGAFASVEFTASPDGVPVLWNGNGFQYHEKLSRFEAVARPAAHAFVRFALTVGMFWPVVWLPLALLRRREVGLRLWPSLGAWCVHLFVDVVYKTEIPQFAHINGRTILIYAVSWAIPVCTVAAVVTTARALARRRAGSLSRLLALLVTTALVLATVHFAWFGVLGVRTWMW